MLKEYRSRCIEADGAESRKQYEAAVFEMTAVEFLDDEFERIWSGLGFFDERVTHRFIKDFIQCDYLVARLLQPSSHDPSALFFIEIDLPHLSRDRRQVERVPRKQVQNRPRSRLGRIARTQQEGKQRGEIEKPDCKR